MRCSRCDEEGLVEGDFGDSCSYCDEGDLFAMDGDTAGWDDVQPPRRTPLIASKEQYKLNVGQVAPLRTGATRTPARQLPSIEELHRRVMARDEKELEEKRAIRELVYWDQRREQAAAERAEIKALLEGNRKVLDKAQADHPDDFRAQFWDVTRYAYDQDRHGFRCPKCNGWVDFTYRMDEDGTQNTVAWYCCT